MLNNKIAPPIPKIVLFFTESDDKKALEQSPSPKSKMGSFNIPDVQKSILGKSKMTKKKKIGLTFEYAQNAINKFFKPIKAIKHMKSEWTNAEPNETN
jgi:hypothetical protein